MNAAYIPSYLAQYFPNIDCTIPRAFDDEQAIMFSSKVELYLLSTLDQPNQIKKWLPQGVKGKLPSGGKYQVIVNPTALAFGDVLLNNEKFLITKNITGYITSSKELSLNVALVELYRRINGLKNIDVAVLHLERKLRFTDKTLTDCLQKWQSSMLDNKFHSPRHFGMNPDFQNGVIDAVDVVCINGKKLVLPLRRMQLIGTELKRLFYLPGDGLLYNQNRIHRHSDVFLTDNIEIAHNMPYKPKFSADMCWVSWYGDRKTVSAVDWSVLKGKQVYYLLKRHSGFAYKEIYRTAYEVYKILKDLGIEMKFIYWITGLDAISQKEASHMPLVIEPKTFLEYASCWVSARHLACFSSDSVQLISECFIKSQSLTLVYGPSKAGLTSLIQHRSFEIAKAGYNVLYVSATKSLQPTYASVDSFLKLGIPEDRLDVTTEEGQILIDVELMRLEYAGSRISLLVLDLESLNRLSRSSEAVNYMSSWLQRLRQRNCAVIILPPGKAWTAKGLRSIKNIPFDNVIRVDKENSYSSAKLAMSLHYELVAGAEKFMKPEVLEYTYKSDTWDKVVDKRVERASIKNEFIKLVNRGASNKDISTALDMKENLVKKRRNEYNLSKPWKNRPQKCVTKTFNAEVRHNKNIYAAINKTLKAYSRDPIDILRQKHFDDEIIAMHREDKSTQQINLKIKTMHGIDIPPEFILKETELADKAKAWLTRPLDPVYPIAFFNFAKVQCRTESKSTEKVICLVSAVIMSGYKELLGMEITDIANEKFMQEMVDNLKARGMERFLIAYVDDTIGETFDIIKDSFADGEVQRDMSAMITASLASVSKEDSKAVSADLLGMFTAETKDKADTLLAELTERWSVNYPSIKQWRNQWKALVPFFSYHPAIRKLIYSYNSSEFISKALKKLHKQDPLPTEAATIKVLYQELTKRSGKTTKPVSNWKSVLNQLHKHFKECFPL